MDCNLNNFNNEAVAAYQKCCKRKKRKKHLIIWLITLAAIVSLILLYLTQIMNPIIISIGGAKVQALATQTMNNSVAEVLTSGYDYNNLVDITYDSGGDVALISANAITINQLAKNVVLSCQDKLAAVGEEGINIPLGSLTGIPIFMGQGPNVPVKIYPIGSVTCSFASQFLSAGVNQTDHRIYINITCTINVVLPIQNKQITANTEVMVAEHVIVGKIPSVYLNADSLDNMLPLIP